MKPVRSIVSLAFLALIAGALPGQQAPRIVASTWWTAAMVRAAGAGEGVIVIAPAELTQPIDYEARPEDLLAIKGADLLLYGGYEKFAPKILEAAARPEAVFKIVTDNRPINLIIETRRIAERLGTVEAQAQWAERFKAFAEASRARVVAALCPDGFPKRRVAVQASLRSWMVWMGFDVVGTFGPGEPDRAKIEELAKARPVLVIDSFHEPSGSALASGLRADYCLLISFPGKDGTATLEDLYAHNEKALLGARPLKAAQGNR